MNSTKATLILDDGSRYHGYSFGSEKNTVGEVVFNTAMVGYPESLTDPSYAGQILVLTYPLVGNYGVPERTFRPDGLSCFMESERIHLQALIVSDYSFKYMHWNASESLSEWLKEEDIPGIFGIDTRALTKKLREKGVMVGQIVFGNDVDEEIVRSQFSSFTYESENFVDKVSCKDVITYNEAKGKKKVVLVDCGVKQNIIRSLINQELTVIRVPWDYDFSKIEYDGLFLSNGPGDPNICDITVRHIRKALNEEKAICGICMGNQLLAKAGGALIYKLKYGHRSHNQPVRLVGTNSCYVTSQNHGYAVDNKSLGSDWEQLFVNMNDGTNEGIKHKSKPFFSAQFHPEVCSGPNDTGFIFSMFAESLY
jgi:carbamoyl-phosphate synthase small subunit